MEVLRLVLNKEQTLLMSNTLITEYEEVLNRPQHLSAFGMATSQVDDLLFALLQCAEQIQSSGYAGPLSSDDDDNHVLDLASAGRADAILTHNTRHFRQAASELGVSLYTPAEFLAQLRSHDV
jgi:putative PIN family toxin of toxin-antitoxin system